MILPGLTVQEQRGLILSVGTHKRQRVLSPVEVGLLMRKAKDSGATAREIADSCHLTDTSMVSRFLRLLELPEVVQTWTAWKPSESELSLTTAQEVARLPNAEAQFHMAKIVLENRLNAKEVGHAIMRIQHAGESEDEAVAAILRLRPRVLKRFVFIATVMDPRVRSSLGRLNQHERNSILAEAMGSLGLRDMTGTLGVNRFTVVADEAAAKGHTADSIEAAIGPVLEALLT